MYRLGCECVRESCPRPLSNGSLANLFQDAVGWYPIG